MEFLFNDPCTCQLICAILVQCDKNSKLFSIFFESKNNNIKVIRRLFHNLILFSAKYARRFKSYLDQQVARIELNFHILDSGTGYRFK